MHTLRRISAAGAAVAVTTLGWLGATAPTISAGIADPAAEEAEFIVPGTYEWTVPTGVVCANFDVYGADGGSGGDRTFDDADVDAANGAIPPDQDGGTGGLGGRTTATVPVTPGEVITLTVGGYGQGGQSVNATPASGPSVGGDNGGGNGGLGDPGPGGGGGGGASDVRQGGTGLDQRIIVAGGGGGGGAASTVAAGSDGGAGGRPGQPGGNSVVSGEVQASVTIQTGGGGGTDSAGGAAGEQAGVSGLPTAGSFGQGGNGGANTNGGGGGGGGWFGGGGGAAGTGSDEGAGGGGGSSYGPAGATFETGVGATNDNNGLIIVRWTPNDTSCQAVAPAAVVTDPTFTG